MAIIDKNITVSFFPTNPANIKDRKGELKFKAIVRTDTENASSKLIVVVDNEEVELYKINGYSKQTETYDGKVIPINRPENTIFNILKESGKLNIRAYESDFQARDFIATGMYIPGSRSGTEQFADTTQRTVASSSSDADKATISDVSPQAAAAVERATNTDSPETTTSLASGEAGAEIPESPPQASNAPDAGDANDGGAPLPGDFANDFLGSGFASEGGFTSLGKGTPGTGGSGLFYPADMATLPQDYIKIQSKRYEPEKFTLTPGGVPSLEAQRDSLQNDGPPIYLAINTALSDNSSVSWGENSLNPIQAFLFKTAYNAITGDPSKAIETAGNVARDNLVKRGDTLGKAAATYFAQQSAGASGLLSRTQGAILNPNLALLFNNPELRKLNLSFKFSPRDDGEATNVRKIIRVFKQTMSVRKEKSNFFLLAPNLYTINYIAAGAGDHKSIGRTKLCALLGCSVNYTPDGSYMTFDDPAFTMTSYEMSLSFNEIEPVYYDEYDKFSDDELGY